MNGDPKEKTPQKHWEEHELERWPEPIPNRMMIDLARLCLVELKRIRRAVEIGGVGSGQAVAAPEDDGPRSPA